MRAVGILLVVILLAGCNGTPPPSTTPPATTPPVEDGFHVLQIDGYWSFFADRAKSVAAKAGYPADDLGVLVAGELALGGVAGRIVAADAKAAQMLGLPAPPEAGSLVLSPSTAAALNASVGDALEARAASWPPSQVLGAFEMERVRPCDPAFPAPLCSLPTPADGTAVLKLRVPPGSSDLRFHADVVELAPTDFPAFWNGTFHPPEGEEMRFATAAIDRATTYPPGAVNGSVAGGDWLIRFTLDANHRRIPGAIAGFVTLRTPGFSPFQIDLMRIPDAAEQTRAFVANATMERASLRVASIADVPGAAALLALDDARALLRTGGGNATALVAPARGADLAAAIAGDEDAAIGALRARPVASPPPVAAATGALVLWAPADIDVGALPSVEGAGAPVVSVESWAPIRPPRIREQNLTHAIRMLSWPVGAPPWALVEKAFWKTIPDASKGMANGPHLLLASDDLVREAGGEPTNATYLKTELETGLGARIVFGMGAVSGGPSSTLWAGAALVASASAPRGVRLVVPLDEGANREAVEEAALAAWASAGVSRLVGP